MLWSRLCSVSVGRKPNSLGPSGRFFKGRSCYRFLSLYSRVLKRCTGVPLKPLRGEAWKFAKIVVRQARNFYYYDDYDDDDDDDDDDDYYSTYKTEKVVFNRFVLRVPEV